MSTHPLRVVVLAPIAGSLFSRLVTFLATREPNIVVTDVIVRTPWTWQRMRGEMRRDGIRLLQKTCRKLVLGEHAYPASDDRTILALKQRVGMPGKSLYDLGKSLNLRVTTVRDHNDEVSLSVIHEAQPDVVAFTGGGLLRTPLLRMPRLGVLNCHMGILPEYRGMDVVEWPLLDATKALPPLGLTLHYMDADVDTGPVLLQKLFHPQPGATLADLRRRLEPMMVELMLDGLRGLRDGKLSPRPQEKSAGKQHFVMHPRLQALAAERLRSLAGSCA